MTLSKTAITSIGLISVTGIGGVGLMVHKLINKESFRDKLAGTLLNSLDEDSSKWTARAELLKKDSSLWLVASLKKIKDEATSEKVKEWCNESLDNYFSEKTQLFKDIQKYCVYNIKEKLNRAIDLSQWSAETHDKKLKDVGNENLSKEMLSIKSNLTKERDSVTDALKKWCESLENIPFKGNNEQRFKDAQAYCAS